MSVHPWLVVLIVIACSGLAFMSGYVVGRNRADRGAVCVGDQD